MPFRAPRAEPKFRAYDPAAVMPLERLPIEHQRRIAEAVAQPDPPPYWLAIGPGPRPLAYMPSRAWWEWHWQRGYHPERRRPKITPAIRRLVIERDGLICGICAGAVEPDDVHIDHIVPVSRGGTGELPNLRVTHSRCNLVKAAKV